MKPSNRLRPELFMIALLRILPRNRFLLRERRIPRTDRNHWLMKRSRQLPPTQSDAAPELYLVDTVAPRNQQLMSSMCGRGDTKRKEKSKGNFSSCDHRSFLAGGAA